MPVAKRPGYYVEGRFFRDNYHQACARAKFLANEYGRRIEVTYLAPEDCGSTNNAVPYGVASFHPEGPRPSKADAVLKFLPSVMQRMADEWEPVLDEVDVRGFMVPKS